MNLSFQSSLHSKINIKWYCTFVCRRNIYSNTRLLKCWSCTKIYNCVYRSEYWMIYRRPGFLAIVWFGSSPIPFPLSRQQVVSLSHTSCASSVHRAFWREGGGGVVKSYDKEKAWSSINYSILPGVQHARSCEYCFEDCTHLAFLFWLPNLTCG